MSDWMAQARCARITNFTNYPPKLRASYCDTCPVKQPCQDEELFDLAKEILSPQSGKKSGPPQGWTPFPNRTHCKRGHEWIAGQERCKTCVAENQRKTYERKKAEKAS